MIYLDNNATTRPTHDVVAAVAACMREHYVNPASPFAPYTESDQILSGAAQAMAKLLNAEDRDCFVFTSGATEANNWAIAHLAHSASQGSILVSGMEHPSLFEPAAALRQSGYEVREIPTNSKGTVDIDAMRASLSEETIGVSVMAANNVTGAMQPLSQIGSLIREYAPKALFHTDATQAVGKATLNLQNDLCEIDLLSFSAHKFHGPRGIGGLYIRPGTVIEPFLLGGGQNRGLRSGTENSPALAGLACAARNAARIDALAIERKRDHFEQKLIALFPTTDIHAISGPRLPNTSCFSIPGTDSSLVAERLAAQGIVVGLGAACSSGSIAPPKALIAMGVGYDLAKSCLRVSSSFETTDEDFDAVIEALASMTAL